MPNLDFYAAADDWPAVLATVFDLGLFRVLEADSAPGRDLREFHTADEVPSGRASHHLALFVTGSGPGPLAARIDFAPGAHPDASFRYTCEGWGLVQLQYGGPFGVRGLTLSHTNHNTAKRAAAWAATLTRLGDPEDWDWAKVTSASGRLNRAIRRLAVAKTGPHPVLPGAARLLGA
ncbi:hypothetical protein JOF53_007113 [Crossiella equi]|uniref:Uncharacterized protein n=1 Tax=Crossiella equi TaxID=130796 RepID=A0ABS5ANW3_9PSEU|nr:hypothetical protein [Crossiella equi]MBP2478241.1 hypothetical protein [Crossiella equi]